MTCVVGLEHHGRVFMGGDRCSSNDVTKTKTAKPKIFKKGPFLIGFSGSFRYADIIQYNVEFPKKSKKMSEEEYLFTVIVEQIRETLSDKGMNLDEDKFTDNALIAYKGKLYELQCDLSLVRNVHGFNAIGNGKEVALGSFYSTIHLPPEERVEMALRAAAEFSQGVSEPFDILVSK